VRKKMIAGNWKMYKTPTEARELSGELLKLINTDQVDVAVFPPFVDLPGVAEILAGSKILWGAQNMYWEKEGAFTGEVSPLMLCDLSCTYVLCGHSERRSYFGQTNEDVAKCANAALKHGLIPIICVGESYEERQAGKAFEVLTNQVSGSLDLWDGFGELLIAYEPVWAIGTGLTATPADAAEACAHIRSLVDKMYGSLVADHLRILYGGSVKPDNTAALLADGNVDGALVGGASLKAADFAAIVQKAIKN